VVDQPTPSTDVTLGTVSVLCAYMTGFFNDAFSVENANIILYTVDEYFSSML